MEGKKFLELMSEAKVQAPQFRTGGDGRTKAEIPAKRPGVQEVPSVFDDAPAQEVLNVTKASRKRVVVLSPFMREDPSIGPKMARYAERCVQNSLNQNEAPLASHLFFYGQAGSNNPIERDIGLHSQLTWIPGAQLVAVYVDFGVTPAMQVAINVAEIKNKKIEYRSIGAVA